MLVRDLAAAMEAIAPLSFAESWDRVGLLVGDPSRALMGPVLLTIDLTERVLDEAEAARADAIIAYHPPIFEPLARITDATTAERIVRRAIESRIAVYSPHTSLDNAAGGMTDWLCEGLSGGSSGKIEGDCRALTPHSRRTVTQEAKIVTFVPEKDAERVRDALATAGAGIIGEYTVCSFSTSGIGTFLGSDRSSPTVGSPGQLERVPEVRLEMVCSAVAVPLAIETLRRFHPYEEPAIDVYALQPQPLRHVGAGRRLTLDRPTTLDILANRLRTFLGTARVEIGNAGSNPSSPVTTVSVVPGAGGALIDTAAAQGCEVFVTGEMKHHDVLRLLSRGISVILAGHTNTERGYLPRLGEKLRHHLPALDVRCAALDRDPLIVMG